jgi:TetR/AcrR family transcriptional regulator of autoinduction and epiphytic fitness
MSATVLPRGPDPRIARSREIILAAALAELGEVGFGAFTIESVASRAGAGKSTIYRLWSDKLTLIVDAFETLHLEGSPDLSHGTPREKLERVLRHVATIASDSPFANCLPALIDGAERDPALRRFHHDFQAAVRQPMIELIAAGIASGDFPSHLDAELTALALLGAIFFRRLMTPEPFDPAQSDALIEQVMGKGETRDR